MSGPIDNDDELICDILTEMVATLFKVFTRLNNRKESLMSQLSNNS